jgi:uncharacterized metal-binding protein YceD (DUF177 family)
MIIEIDKIPKEGLAVSKDFEFLNTDLVEENTVFLSATHAEAVVHRVGEEIWMALMKVELDEDDLDSGFYDNNEINLHEVILEQLNLTFPLKPLCSEDCEGICPVCGQVRRGDNCACLVKEEDPRLQRLKNFMRDKK